VADDNPRRSRSASPRLRADSVVDFIASATGALVVDRGRCWLRPHCAGFGGWSDACQSIDPRSDPTVG